MQDAMMANVFFLMGVPMFLHATTTLQRFVMMGAVNF